MRKFGWTLAVAAVALIGACDKKSDEIAAEPAKVEGAVSPATPAEEPKVEAAPSAPSEASATTVAAAQVEDKAAGGEHAGCAEMAAGDDEKDCPFPEEKAAAAIEGCGSQVAVEPAKTETGLRYGGAFSLSEAKPLGTVLAGAVDGQEMNVRVSGQIDKVCQKKGCWMVVKDGEVEARVVMKDHAFTVPLDATGKPTQVEGTLKVRIFTEAQAKHLAEDGGEDPSKVTGEKKELVLTATAVEIGS